MASNGNSNGGSNAGSNGNNNGNSNGGSNGNNNGDGNNQGGGGGPTQRSYDRYGGYWYSNRYAPPGFSSFCYSRRHLNTLLQSTRPAREYLFSVSVELNQKKKDGTFRIWKGSYIPFIHGVNIPYCQIKHVGLAGQLPQAHG